MTSKQNVTKKLFDLEEDLQAEIDTNEFDTVRHALVHVRDGIQHLRDALTAEESIR
jgi:protein-arginine kinase activator protein McsA